MEKFSSYFCSIWVQFMSVDFSRCNFINALSWIYSCNCQQWDFLKFFKNFRILRDFSNRSMHLCHIWLLQSSWWKYFCSNWWLWAHWHSSFECKFHKLMKKRENKLILEIFTAVWNVYWHWHKFANISSIDGNFNDCRIAELLHDGPWNVLHYDTISMWLKISTRHW